MSDSGPGLPRPGRSMRERTSALLTGALGSAILMIVLVSVMWAIEIVDYVEDGRLDRYGIVAHETDGLPGILFAPFLHAGFGHLMANSVPLLILGFVAAIRGIGRFLAASLVVILVSGLGVWFTSPPDTLTIGASGLVFGYFGYVVARGLFDRRTLDIVLGVVVAVLYYSILWGALPTQPGVSWQGHLFGLIGGVLAAWLLRRRRPVTI
ncbi:rhomboid family intramembrane serine protease [Microbispora hainanensis]|uniref:rhomboid family intramembrane serine protease n=1 Tax=Microbispora TaxID=2005 RepID=UPI0011583B90|nr:MULTISPECIES: rhomboid family intramembrane serine protease [Microbispora]NJP28772.1 rhomboid family intramembrane serine protease [Microbispora sp. CL1-1]TQS07454.1 rhomboid family intramembrane serine protease [Microbispora sp. SCL1-1]